MSHNPVGWDGRASTGAPAGSIGRPSCLLSAALSTRLPSSTIRPEEKWRNVIRTIPIRAPHVRAHAPGGAHVLGGARAGVLTQP